jgi:cytochrome c peroxidase
MRSSPWRAALAKSLAASAVVLAACTGDSPAGPAEGVTLARGAAVDPLVAEVRMLTAARGITRLESPPPVRQALVQLGRALAFDKILSGNRDISCMSCHLPGFATGDGRSLSVGQGATGLGPDRVHPEGAFIARNAPAALNLHAVGPMFWDGRVFIDDGGTMHTPAGAKVTPEMQSVFEFGALSAQPMFPVLSREEMRGFSGNELAALGNDQEAEIWGAIMDRLGSTSPYPQMFEAAYRGQKFENMTFAHAANAIAGFLVSELSFNNSPWDRFLAGDDGALSPVQLAGAKNFMAARCSLCHNGPAFTDNTFHNVAIAQLGPGTGDGAGGHDDFGRMKVTGLASDRYAFRTTPLRNVELTGPWGHDGAFTDLRAFVDHYSESDVKLHTYDASQLEPVLQGTVQPTADAILATRDTLLDGVVFTPQQVDEVTEFMRALTDPAARDLRRLAPRRVPSGLPVDGSGHDRRR